VSGVAADLNRWSCWIIAVTTVRPLQVIQINESSEETLNAPGDS